MKTKLTAIRIPIEVLNIIDEISKTSGKNKTDVILTSIKKGLINQNVIDLTNKFLNEQEKLMMNTIASNKQVGTNILLRAFERDSYRCRKCNSTDNAMEVQLPIKFDNKTFAGLGCESTITLCLKCKKEFDLYYPKKYELERFIEWFYGS